MKKIILHFVCSSCKEKLESKRENDCDLWCKKCKAVYQNNDGIYNFLPKCMSSFKGQEASFHSDIVGSYHDTAQLDARRNRHAHDDFLASLLTLQKDAMILELGCGLGQDGRVLMRNGFFVVQSDISQKTIARAKETAEKEHLQTSIHLQLDSENLPFQDNYFDAIFMIASLHHMMNPLKAIQEMKRCTKQNGVIILGIEPNKWQYYCIFPLIRFHKKCIKRAEKFSPGDETTYGFNKNDFMCIAKQFNLKIVRITPVWYINGIMHVGLEALYRFLRLQKRIRLPDIVEKMIEHVDNCIAEIPILKNYPWHWNVVMQKKEQKDG